MRPVADIFRSYAMLDADGRHVGGTDKQSNHNYGDSYEALFPERDTIELMMEVGIADGSSLLAWSEIFPNALCVGMDIHPSANARGPRIEFHQGDQRSLEDCLRVAGGRQFDFICEDATHKLEDSLRTLLYLWPFVKPGGIYVIEEFDNIGALRNHVLTLWQDKGRCGEAVRSTIIDTHGPFGGVEPLVVLRKPL